MPACEGYQNRIFVCTTNERMSWPYTPSPLTTFVNCSYYLREMLGVCLREMLGPENAEKMLTRKRT